MNDRTISELRLFASVPEAGWPHCGEVSVDLTAAIGSGNWIYLYRGSNDYFAAYQDTESAEADADAWGSYFRRWKIDCEESGRKFAVVIVPNKATVIPQYYPFALDSHITWRMKHLLDGFGSDIIFPLDSIFEACLADVMFRRNDSHLTDAGSLYIASLVLDRMGIDCGLPSLQVPTQVRSARHHGDLGHRFGDGCYEQVYRLARDLSQVAVNQLSSATGKSGFVGLSYRTCNPNAPIKGRLLVFGNSFFEKVPSWGMAPDFALTFEEIVFVWTDTISKDLISKFDPHFVLFQTCERFLGRRPTLG